MQAEFWHKRWERSEIGFHQAQVNDYLQQYWGELSLPIGVQVLVPLSSKSLDLRWLADQGYRAVGVELSEKAVEDFFVEQGITPVISTYGSFKRYDSERITLLCGDFFALSAEQASDFYGLYDRAALIALPELMRERYVAHLNAILPRGCKALLVSLDYEQAQMSGPPFAVSDAQVQRLYARDWQIQQAERYDVLQLDDNWRFLKRGLSRLDEWVYCLEKRQ